MKLIIAGSRSITDYEALKRALVQSGLWAEYGHDIQVVCGEARGVDALGRKFAERNSLTVLSFPAAWEDINAEGAVVKTQQSTGRLYNAVAGHWRNAKMAEFADALLLLWDGKSTGSKDMLARAKKKGIPTYVYEYKDGEIFPVL